MYAAEQISKLNEIELFIYNYVLQNYKKVAYMRIRDMAEETNVSTATILRFCRKLGFDGFTEFRYDLKNKITLMKGEYKITTFDKNDLVDFVNKSSTDDFIAIIRKAASLIRTYNNIVFVGIGNSGIISSFGARYFTEVVKFTTFFNDPFVDPIREYTEDTLVIAISATGESTQTINIVQRFKLSGAKIISITNSNKSTISKLSDYCIAYNSTSQKDILKYKKAASQIEHVFIIEMLAHCCQGYF